MKFSVKLHKEFGENRLTHSALHFLDPVIPPPFHRTDHHQHLFSPFLWHPSWLNKSVDICSGIDILLRWGSWIPKAIAYLDLGFIVCLPVVLAVSWMIHVSISVKSIFGVQNAFRSTVRMTLGRMAVDSLDSGDIQYLRWSSQEVLWRQRW